MLLTRNSGCKYTTLLLIGKVSCLLFVQCGTGSLLFLVFLRGHSGFSFEEFTEEGRVGKI